MKLRTTKITCIFSALLCFISIELSSQIVKLDPSEDYVKIVNNHFQNSEWEEGKKVLDKAVKESPKDSDLRLLLGRYYYEKKNYDLARYELMEALEYNKNNVSAKQILVNVEIETQRYSSAICYINELLEVNPYWKGLWLKKIDAYKLQGNTEEANRLLTRLYKIYPNDPQIKDNFLYNMEQNISDKKNSGELNEAITMGASLIEKAPQNEALYVELVNNCLKTGDYDKALMYAERGLYNIPGSTALIDKKVDILGEQHRYNEALKFLQFKIKSNSNKAHLQRRYNLILEEAAHHHRQSDPYTLYRILYEQNPRNDDVFTYVMNQALTNGYHDDALEIVKKAQEVKGETKDLLLKEQTVYARMGAQSKADQMTVRLYQLYPDDYDVKYQYTLYRQQQGKSYMSEGVYDKALDHWLFVSQNGEAEDKKTALAAIHNCSFQLREHDKALSALDQLISDFPEEVEWRIKKTVIFAEQGKYKEALDEYGHVVLLADSDEERERALRGYDEVATACTKKLLEHYLFGEAKQLVNQWLEVNPQSDMGLKYAMNIAMHTEDFESVKKHATAEAQREYGDINHEVKLAQAHHNMKEYREAINVLTPYITKNPYHKDVVGAYSQACEDYARGLLKEMKYGESMAILDSALLYDPQNKALKYWKGNVYEKIHAYDSAYYYQSFYTPDLLELKPFENRLKALKYKAYKNKVGLYYLRGRFNDQDVISYVSTLEYTRFCGADNYTGRVNYTGRQGGKGIQGQAEWTRTWKTDLYTRADVAIANKFFSSFMANAAIYKGFKYGWEAELGGGYRRMADKKNMYNIVGGVAKELDLWWLNARLNSIILDKKYYYSVLVQSRFYYNEWGSYFMGMASVGSAPDVDVIDNQLYDGFSVTNSMVGLGVHHLLTDRIAVALSGNWYNYEDKNYTFEEGDGKYRNFYNIYLQLHVKF